MAIKAFKISSWSFNTTLPSEKPKFLFFKPSGSVFNRKIAYQIQFMRFVAYFTGKKLLLKPSKFIQEVSRLLFHLKMQKKNFRPSGSVYNHKKNYKIHFMRFEDYFSSKNDYISLQNLFQRFQDHFLIKKSLHF